MRDTKRLCGSGRIVNGAWTLKFRHNGILHIIHADNYGELRSQLESILGR